MLVNESKNKHTARGETPLSAASLVCGLLEPEATHTVGSLLPIAHLYGALWQTAQLGSRCVSEAGASRHLCTKRPAWAGFAVSRKRRWRNSVRPRGRDTGHHPPHQLPASRCRHSDGHLEGRGQSSLSDPPAKRRKAAGGRLMTKRKGFISNQWVKW